MPLRQLLHTVPALRPLPNSIVRTITTTTTTTRLMTTSTPTPKSALPKNNPYFSLGGKDIWSLINETAAAKEASSGTKVANLGQGFFSYSPPKFAVEAAQKAFENAMDNQYAPSQGKPQLVNALAKHYSGKLSYPVTANNVQVTTGANEGMLAVFFAFLSAGDEVIVFQPYFDQYIPNIEMTGAKVVYAELHTPPTFSTETVAGSDYFIDWDELESLITEKTKMVVINTPHNPIGKVFTREELDKLGKLAVKHNFLILSDEVYENLYYTPTFPRIADSRDLEVRRRSLFVGSAGKTFAATGWRIGWIIGSEELIPYVKAAHTRVCFSSPAPIQVAVANAITIADGNGYYAAMREEYKQKYAILEAVFDELNLPYTRAEGGYFILVNLAKVQLPELEWPEDIKNKPRDFKLAYWLIEEFGVVSIPPSEFYLAKDAHKIEDCLRFAVCKGDDVLHDAADRLKGLKKYIK
jgi:kynurenine aminotransferase